MHPAWLSNNRQSFKRQKVTWTPQYKNKLPALIIALVLCILIGSPIIPYEKKTKFTEMADMANIYIIQALCKDVFCPGCPGSPSVVDRVPMP